MKKPGSTHTDDTNVWFLENIVSFANIMLQIIVQFIDNCMVDDEQLQTFLWLGE